jgi:hypothetical protein
MGRLKKDLACGNIPFDLVAQHSHGSGDNLTGVRDGKAREIVISFLDAFKDICQITIGTRSTLQ